MKVSSELSIVGDEPLDGHLSIQNCPSSSNSSPDLPRKAIRINIEPPDFIKLNLDNDFNDNLDAGKFVRLRALGVTLYKYI